MSSSRKALTYSNITATLALVVAMSGTAVAATKIGTNQIANGAVTTSKLHKAAVTGKKVKPGSLTSTSFAAGAVPTVLWAVVNADGTLDRGSHVVSTAKVDFDLSTTGSYEVIFDRDVTQCAYLGTLGGANTAFSQGQITTFPRNNNVNGAFAFTYDDGGVRADRLFQLAVVC